MLPPAAPRVFIETEDVAGLAWHISTNHGAAAGPFRGHTDPHRRNAANYQSVRPGPIHR
jgi:hypothetical protein